MKRFILFLLVTVVFCSCQNDYTENIQGNDLATRSVNTSGYYYWCEGEKIPLTLNESKSFVLTKSEKRITMESSQVKAMNAEDITYVAPYFTLEGVDIGITNALEVRVENEQDFARLEKLATEYNFIVTGQSKYDPTLYVLECSKESKGNALEMANLMYEVGGFKYATPEFIMGAELATSDTYSNNQWALHNTNYPHIDINYINASTISLPYINNVIVAVIDDGVELNHPDLPLFHSYDIRTGTSPNVVYGGHGTNCAGIIAATANNNKGIAGVASGVKLMSISFVPHQSASDLIPQSTRAEVANAIRYAANNGADVISNSWYYPLSSSSPIPEIRDAINYAHNKNCVVVFCSGNEGTHVRQPAAGPPDVLVVGAMIETGERASFSNYGSQLDVVAPGDRIYTTDTQGGRPYILDGYYYSNFGGTSAATPHVAGVAALILSKNPNFTRYQVVDIIEKSTRKVGGYGYATTSGRHNGTWHNEMGYGLVDAYAAVTSPAPVPSTPQLRIYDYHQTITPPNEIAQVYNSNPEPGVTYEWWTYGGEVMYYDNNSLGIAAPSQPYSSSTMEVRCRANRNGVYSSWSNTLYMEIDWSEIYYSSSMQEEEEAGEAAE